MPMLAGEGHRDDQRVPPPPPQSKVPQRPPLCIDDFDVGQELGKGGFAVVYRARVRASGLEVALKVVDKHRACEQLRRIHTKSNADTTVNGHFSGRDSAELAYERVANEVRLHWGLKHPTVVELLDFFEDKKFVYMALELCGGGDLYRRLRDDGPLSERDASGYMGQLLAGLAYLHERGVMHRDLKLSNLLLSQDGRRLRIGDLGLAVKLEDGHQERHTICGTPNYMAPEIQGEGYGMSADLWSAGCLFYAMVTGRAPFQGRLVGDTLANARDGRYEEPEGLSASGKDFLACLLNVDPKRRLRVEQAMEHPFLRFDKARPKSGTSGGPEATARVHTHTHAVDEKARSFAGCTPADAAVLPNGAKGDDGPGDAKAVTKRRGGGDRDRGEPVSSGKGKESRGSSRHSVDGKMSLVQPPRYGKSSAGHGQLSFSSSVGGGSGGHRYKVNAPTGGKAEAGGEESIVGTTVGHSSTLTASTAILGSDLWSVNSSVMEDHGRGGVAGEEGEGEELDDDHVAEAFFTRRPDAVPTPATIGEKTAAAAARVRRTAASVSAQAKGKEAAREGALSRRSSREVEGDGVARATSGWSPQRDEEPSQSEEAVRRPPRHRGSHNPGRYGSRSIVDERDMPRAVHVAESFGPDRKQGGTRRDSGEGQGERDGCLAGGVEEWMRVKRDAGDAVHRVRPRDFYADSHKEGVLRQSEDRNDSSRNLEGGETSIHGAAVHDQRGDEPERRNRGGQPRVILDQQQQQQQQRRQEKQRRRRSQRRSVRPRKRYGGDSENSTSGDDCVPRFFSSAAVVGPPARRRRPRPDGIGGGTAPPSGNANSGRPPPPRAPQPRPMSPVAYDDSNLRSSPSSNLLDVRDLRELRAVAAAERDLHETGSIANNRRTARPERSRPDRVSSLNGGSTTGMDEARISFSTARLKPVFHRSGEKAAIEVFEDGRASITVGRRWLTASGNGERLWAGGEAGAGARGWSCSASEASEIAVAGGREGRRRGSRRPPEGEKAVARANLETACSVDMARTAAAHDRGRGSGTYGANADGRGYTLESLPATLYPLYKSLAGIVNALRSKTPKVLLRWERTGNDGTDTTAAPASTTGVVGWAKDTSRETALRRAPKLVLCALMENMPDPDFTATFDDGSTLSLLSRKNELRLELPCGRVLTWPVAPGSEWPSVRDGRGSTSGTIGGEGKRWGEEDATVSLHARVRGPGSRATFGRPGQRDRNQEPESYDEEFVYVKAGFAGYCECLMVEAETYRKGTRFPVEVEVEAAAAATESIARLSNLKVSAVSCGDNGVEDRQRESGRKARLPESRHAEVDGIGNERWDSRRSSTSVAVGARVEGVVRGSSESHVGSWWRGDDDGGSSTSTFESSPAEDLGESTQDVYGSGGGGVGRDGNGWASAAGSYTKEHHDQRHRHSRGDEPYRKTASADTRIKPFRTYSRQQQEYIEEEDEKEREQDRRRIKELKRRPHDGRGDRRNPAEIGHRTLLGSPPPAQFGSRSYSTPTKAGVVRPQPQPMNAMRAPSLPPPPPPVSLSRHDRGAPAQPMNQNLRTSDAPKKSPPPKLQASSPDTCSLTSSPRASKNCKMRPVALKRGTTAVNIIGIGNGQSGGDGYGGRGDDSDTQAVQHHGRPRGSVAVIDGLGEAFRDVRGDLEARFLDGVVVIVDAKGKWMRVEKPSPLSPPASSLVQNRQERHQSLVEPELRTNATGVTEGDFERSRETITYSLGGKSSTDSAKDNSGGRRETRVVGEGSRGFVERMPRDVKERMRALPRFIAVLKSVGAGSSSPAVEGRPRTTVATARW